jgi:hypothetical protein
LILSVFPAIFFRRPIMAESAQLGDQPVPQSAVQGGEPPLKRAWRKVKRGFVRSIFWAYERGTWQYDLLVLAILAFIFLSPRSWFEDRPTLQLTDLRHRQGVVEVRQGKEGWTYLVDARLVEAQAPKETNAAIREILRLRLQRPFTIKSSETIRDRNNVILGYTVVVVFQ